MSSDIASLGIKIDSSQTVAATAALDKFAAAAKPAGSAVSALEQASKKTSAAHAALSGQSQAAMHSLRSMFEQAAMGVPVSQMLTQQLGHLSYAASGPGGLTGAFAGAASALRGFATPATLAVGGLAALGVTAYAAYASWSRFALTLDDVARRAGTTTAEMSKLQSAASFKGINGSEFTKGIEKFSDEVYQAQRGLGGLAETFRANGLHAKTFNDYIDRAADLIQRASSDQQRLVILQQMGLPATMEWVRLLSNGSAGLDKLKAQAAEFGGAINDDMVARARAFDEAWNQTTTNFATGWRNAFLNTLSGFEWFQDKISAGLMHIADDVPQTILKNAFANGGGSRLGANSDVGAFYGKTGADTSALRLTVNGAADKDTLKAQLGLENQRIAILGTLATVQDAAKAKENEITLARLAGVKGLDAYRSSLILVATAQAESSKLAQAAQFGVFDTTRQYANAQRELQIAIKSGAIDASDYAAAWGVVSKRLRESADAATVARSALEQTARHGLDAANTAKQWDGVFISTFNSMENSFASFVIGSKTASAAFKDFTDSVLSDLARMVVRQNITGPLASMLGGANSAGGSTFLPSASFLDHGFGFGHDGMIVGGTPTFTRNVHPAYFDDAPRFHTGGLIGMDEVPIVAKRGEGIFTPAQMAALAPVRSGGNVYVNIQGAPSTPQVSQSKTADGHTQLDIKFLTRAVDDIIAGGLRGGQSATHAAIAERFGVTPKL